MLTNPLSFHHSIIMTIVSTAHHQLFSFMLSPSPSLSQGGHEHGQEHGLGSWAGGRYEFAERSPGPESGNPVISYY